MSTSDRSKRISKGRRWIFSKKKMKIPDDKLGSIHDLKKLLEYREIHLKPHPSMKKSSKLTPSLFDVLKKSTVLGYFLDFLKLENKKNCLDFWLEAEAFYMTSKFNMSKNESRWTNFSTQSSPMFGRSQKFSDGMRSISFSSLSSSCSKSRSSYLGHPEETPHAPILPHGEVLETEGRSLFSPLLPTLHSSCDENEISEKARCSCYHGNHVIDNSQPPYNVSMNTQDSNPCPDIYTNENSLCSCSNINNSLTSSGDNIDCDTVSSCKIDNSMKTDLINEIHPSNHNWVDKPVYDDVCVTTASDLSKDENERTNDSSGTGSSMMEENNSSISSFDEHYKQSGCCFSGDALTIYKKFIRESADLAIDLPLEARQEIEAEVLCNERNTNPELFVKAQEIITNQLARLHADFLRADSMINYQINLLEEGAIRFEDVLYHKELLFYFMEYLDQMNWKTCLEFYMTAVNFEEDVETKLMSDGYNAESAVSDAMYIYERYFSMKCDHQLIDDDKLRIVIENNICRPDGPQPNCFCIPLAYAWTVLSDIYTPSFLESHIFRGYINHLQNTQSSADECCSVSKRNSISIDNPVEQSETKVNMLDNKNLEEFWFKSRTENAGRLSLGRVNEYGLFNSEMEPEPAGRKGGDSSVAKLGRAMRNLLRRETQEETERLAWRRARKIIADIQKETASESIISPKE